MKVKLTNNPMAFESINCPRLNKPYICFCDFEVPTNISFNSVYYWNNNEWEVVERKKAESEQLIFQVPANGLFYLRDTKNDVESHHL